MEAIISFIYPLFSEKAADDAVFVHIDPLGGRRLGQTRHGHDVPGEGHKKARARGDLKVFDGDSEALRRAQLCGVIGKTVLGLGDADGELVKTQRRKLVNLLLCTGEHADPGAAVDPADNGLQLFLNGGGELIAIRKVPLFLPAQAHNLPGQIFPAFTAFGPDVGQDHVHTQLPAFFHHAGDFRLGIRGELVHGHDTGKLIYVPDVAHMAQQVGQAL